MNWCWNIELLFSCLETYMERLGAKRRKKAGSEEPAQTVDKEYILHVELEGTYVK